MIPRHAWLVTGAPALLVPGVGFTLHVAPSQTVVSTERGVTARVQCFGGPSAEITELFFFPGLSRERAEGTV